MKSWRLGLLGLAVSAGAIYFIVSQLDVARFGEALRTARYIYVLPGLALLLVGMWTRAVRWRVLLSESLPPGRAFNILNVSYLVNGVLPLRAGELARAYLATRAEPPVPVFKSASTIIVERLLDLLAVLVLLGVALAAGPVPAELRAAAFVATPVALAGFFMLIFLAHQRSLAQRLLRIATSRITTLQKIDLAAWLDQFLDGLQPLTQSSSLGKALFWSVVSWGASLTAGYILMFAFFERGDWIAASLFIAAASLAIALPAVPGNIGPYELSIILALDALGYGDPAARASAFAVLVHGLSLLVFATLGTVGFIQEGISLGQLRVGVQQMQHIRLTTQDVSQRE